MPLLSALTSCGQNIIFLFGKSNSLLPPQVSIVLENRGDSHKAFQNATATQVRDPSISEAEPEGQSHLVWRDCHEMVFFRSPSV
jgi:hypothetical protein